MARQDSISMTPELHYRDPDAALAWLSRVFGFQTRMIVADDKARTVFAEASWNDISVAIVPEEPDALKRSPQSTGGTNTQLIRIRGAIDVESHCLRARPAGATIIQEPTQYFFGDRVYVVSDLEGHIWSFAQRVPGANGPPPKGWTVSFPSTTSEK